MVQHPIHFSDRLADVVFNSSFCGSDPERFHANDEYVGENGFDSGATTPSASHEGCFLMNYGDDQRNVPASIGDGHLMTTTLDSEGRFQRERAGRVTQIVYYEFGTRLGISRKTDD